MLSTTNFKLQQWGEKKRKRQRVRGRSGTPCAILKVANHSLHHGRYTRCVIGKYCVHLSCQSYTWKVLFEILWRCMTSRPTTDDRCVFKYLRRKASLQFQCHLSAWPPWALPLHVGSPFRRMTLHHSASHPLHHQHPKRRFVALRSTCKAGNAAVGMVGRNAGVAFGRKTNPDTHHPLWIFKKRWGKQEALTNRFWDQNLAKFSFKKI